MHIWLTATLSLFKPVILLRNEIVKNCHNMSLVIFKVTDYKSGSTGQ
jgi:hypothetical protein